MNKASNPTLSKTDAEFFLTCFLLAQLLSRLPARFEEGKDQPRLKNKKDGTQKYLSQE
jgi:hypothetical protein